MFCPIYCIGLLEKKPGSRGVAKNPPNIRDIELCNNTAERVLGISVPKSLCNVLEML